MSPLRTQFLAGAAGALSSSEIQKPIDASCCAAVLYSGPVHRVGRITPKGHRHESQPGFSKSHRCLKSTAMMPTHRPPTHPGEMLLKEFLEPLQVSQVEAAKRVNIPFQRLNAIVKGRRGVSAETAGRVSLSQWRVAQRVQTRYAG